MRISCMIPRIPFTSRYACSCPHVSQPDYTTCQHNDCLQILLAHESVLVVRARSIQLFPFPELKPYADYPQHQYDTVAHYSFGWVDGISVAICPHLSTSTTFSRMDERSWAPICILIRGECDDPWTQDEHYLEFYTLFPNSDYVHESPVANKAARSVETTSVPHNGTMDESSMPADLKPLVSPYIFPPQKSYCIKSRRGSLRCRHITLGRFGTAAWLEPQERFSSGLVTDFPSQMYEQWRWQDEDQVQRHECSRLCVFPGPLTGQSDEVQSIKLLDNEENNWTCFDYDEIGGRIVFGSSFGKIAVVYLV